jgi:hypothetical protein
MSSTEAGERKTRNDFQTSQARIEEMRKKKTDQKNRIYLVNL